MITKGLEDYLELIYNLVSNGKDVKAVDIANEFNISRSSVSEALIRLADSDLIIYEGRKGIRITEKGKAEAKRIIDKHSTLFEFLQKVLEFDSDTANRNACEIEHVIDVDVIKKIKLFNDFCLQNDINKKFKNFLK